ncbi:regulating synaptic membrane exocytosis protein 1-like isoform X2 [Artemia franciscana]|uniref:Regulating synaptic membrane exocytosis protein 2 n=1 Tax=Artemia franciscana TaxID=6661 RepID=A0AA88HXQ3_ARTSF|nr:hypothetical protein QYM36_006161 [Artemia franciscana]
MTKTDLIPDLSHLTEDERRIIESVMMRQKEEEQKETEIMKRKQDEVKVLEDTIRQRNLQRRNMGNELDATCQICLKTKFADGVGHICNYCAVRCCARCGGKVSLRSSKIIWVCILCRKKQELLIKTGQWIHTAGSLRGPDSEAGSNAGTPVSTPTPSLIGDKRPRLERTTSSEKENNKPMERMVLQRTNSLQGNESQTYWRQLPREPSDTHRCVSRGQRRYSATSEKHDFDGRSDRSHIYQDQNNYHEPPRLDVTTDFGRRPSITENRRKLSESEGMRNDSLSSDQSENMRPPPPKPFRQRARVPSQNLMDTSSNNMGRRPRRRSLSSSEEELRSTSGGTSCDDYEVESESVSEKGEVENSSDKSWKQEDNVTSRVKNLVSHPVTWQPSSDGAKMVGHMVLKKDSNAPGHVSSAAILGLKIVGGKTLENGKLGAIVEKVKRGSIADSVGHLRPGDEVLDWNGRSLQNKTFEEVYDILAETRHEPQVELVVSRMLSDIGRQSGPMKYVRPNNISRELPNPRGRDRPAVTVTSPTSPDQYHPRASSPSHCGRIQVKLWFDPAAHQLAVTVVGAMNLRRRSGTSPRNPYAKLFLLPDRSEKSKRRTRAIANTLEPRWNQTFLYSPVRRADLRIRSLEVTVFDYDRYEASHYIGEVVIELSSALLDGEPEWYYLTACEESINQRRGGYLDTEVCSPIGSLDHISPPSTTSRLSDSDPSELDPEEAAIGPGPRDKRCDVASISSFGSSASPPFEPDYERRRGVSYATQGGRRDNRPVPATLRDDYYRRSSTREDSGRSHQVLTRQRSHSAAPTDYPEISRLGRARSRSPRRVSDPGSRSLSPPENRISGAIPSRSVMASRSAVTTPTGSPKKRQLPQIPPSAFHLSREKMRQESDDRPRQLRSHQMSNYRMSNTVGPNSARLYSGHSDNDLLGYERGTRYRGYAQDDRLRKSDGLLSPDREGVADSDIESVVSGMSALSTQSERPMKSNARRGEVMQSGTSNGGMDRRMMSERSISQSDCPPDDKIDGSLSDTAVNRQSLERSKRGHGRDSRTSSKGDRNLSKKSSSTSQLSATDRKRQQSTSGIQRCQEVIPPNRLVRQTSRESTDGSSMNSVSSDGSSWVALSRLAPESSGQLSEFVEGLGPGQLVGRQVLGTPALGDVQLALCDRKGHLEVEVIRARGLQTKPNAKVLPAPYVKVYLVNGKRCIAKAKTSTARRTLDPLYQQQLVFHENYSGCVLQVTVWGDYGRIEGKKVFMGVAQIMLDDLVLSSLVIGWYKLFGTHSLVSLPPVSKRGSSNSLDSIG